MPAELPLVPPAMALATAALLFFVPRRRSSFRGLAMAFIVAGAALPVALYPLIDASRASGQALWRWSAVGGPSIGASYRLDALAAVTLALTVAFTGAALATAGRTEGRHPALPALVLAIGFVTIALVVTADLVAAIVVLAVLAAITVLALFAVAPAAATARAAGYLSIGIQAWVLAALLISRGGSAAFLIGELPAAAVTIGAILAATGGALLFAGLYPVVAWSFDGHEGNDPGALGSLLLMPAGIGATMLLLRLVAASRLVTAQIPLPEIGREAQLLTIVLVLSGLAVRVAMGSGGPLRPLAIGATLVLLIAAIPLLGWAHAVLIAVTLTILYAGVVSLASPDHWETVRSDLALVALWIAITTGSPLGIAGGIVALFARAAAALTSALWLVPHRDYVALLGGSAVFIAATIVVGVGAITASDPTVAAAAALGVAMLVLLELAQVARRFRVADVPLDLDATSGLAAFLLALFATILVVPLEAAVREQVPGEAVLTATHIAAVTIAAALAVVLARTVGPLLPYFESAATRSGPAMRALDPVPIGAGAFRALELAATRATATFAEFEKRAGVWLATAVILALLVWAVR